MSALTVYLGLGSNLGDRFGFLESAVRQLRSDSRFTLLRRAQVYQSRALGAGAGDDFLNTAVSGSWTDTPPSLLGFCQSIELAHGRTRSYPDAPRTLDIDILWWEGVHLTTPELCVPHPRLLERAFALVPLLEIAPHLTNLDTGEALTRSLSTALLHQGIEEAPHPAHVAESAHA